MKNILLIGVGGTGSSAVDALYHKLREMGSSADTKITALVFDTDIGSIARITAANSISMADTAGVGAVCDRLGVDTIGHWFPYDVPSVRSQDLIYGASQWRKKSYLAFLNAMNKQASYTTFIRALEEVGKNAGDTCEVYVIASIAGGTGSGSFIPIALFAKRYLCNTMHRDPMVNAMIALPEIYEESQTPENRVKIYANAYAILRELNAINLVSRGYNQEIVGEEKVNKKAPIRFSIGSEKDRNVGLLFDASKEEFWTPKAAPFDQIYILDRVPGVHSIHAHDEIMANSLYAIIGTKMGGCIKTVQNNALTTLTQNNGSNAIYAGISTAELRFPRETILSYLAHEKAYRACEEEWLVLHRATEDAIREKERRARSRKKRFTLEDGAYASIYLTQLKNQFAAPTSNVTAIVTRNTSLGEKETDYQNNTAKDYFEKLLTLLAEQITEDDATSGKSEIQQLNRLAIAHCPGFFERIFKKSALRATVAKNMSTVGRLLTRYYEAVCEFIRDSEFSLTDAILSFQKGKDLLANEKYSLVANLLMKDGKHVHPVSAMVQLCRLKEMLKEYLDPLKNTEWAAVSGSTAEGMPPHLLTKGAATASSLKDTKSYYYNLDQGRLASVIASTEEYRKAKTDPYTDNAYLVADAVASIENMRRLAIEQLALAVFTRLSGYVDGLIAKYREFFDHFEEARRELAEALRNEKLRDDGRVDSVLNVYSSVGDKEKLYKKIDDHTDETDESLAESDHIAGDSVFALCYDTYAREISDDFRYSEQKNISIRSLFDNMVENYKKAIKESNREYKDLAKMDVFQALRHSCIVNGQKLIETLEYYLQSAMSMAQPSLVVDSTHRDDGTVKPSPITVAMISTKTAEELWRERNQYGIEVPNNIAQEHVRLETCAEVFLKKYTANSSLQVAVVDGMPDNVMYITGQKTNITPLRIEKFDELSSRPIYFSYYQEAIANSRRYETDMWNPHIGFDLHKRGYLPYMNPVMEERCDEELIKALFYALSHGFIFYKCDATVPSGCYRVQKDGMSEMLRGSNNKMITKNDEAQLLNWLRNQDDYVKNWSKLFDRELDDQKRKLPVIIAESQRGTLETAITTSPFSRMLRSALFKAPAKAKKNADETAPVTEEANGMGILEFAYRIKASEEAFRDCNDAERVIRVAYKIFLDFCEYRVNRQVNPGLFAQIYMQQIEALFTALAKSETVKKQRSYTNGLALYNHIVSWINGAKTFLDIPAEMVDEYGRLLIDEPFRYLESADVMKALKESLEDASEDA